MLVPGVRKLSHHLQCGWERASQVTGDRFHIPILFTRLVKSRFLNIWKHVLNTKLKRQFPFPSSYVGRVLGTQTTARSPQAAPRAVGADSKGDGSGRLAFRRRSRRQFLSPVSQHTQLLSLCLCCQPQLGTLSLGGRLIPHVRGRKSTSAAVDPAPKPAAAEVVLGHGTAVNGFSPAPG